MTAAGEVSADPLDAEALELIDAVDSNPDEETVARSNDWIDQSERHANRMIVVAAQWDKLRALSRTEEARRRANCQARQAERRRLSRWIWLTVIAGVVVLAGVVLILAQWF